MDHGDIGMRKAPHSWLVVFCDPAPMRPDADGWERWVRKLLAVWLKRGMRHVFCLRRSDAFDGWVAFHPEIYRTAVLEYHGDAYVEFLRKMAETGSVTLVEFEGRTEPGWFPWGTKSCVGRVKGVLGIRSRSITPAGLYRDLQQRLSVERD